MNVLKISGSLEVFSQEKLIRSLYNSGVTDEQLWRVLGAIEAELYEGITTVRLFKIVHKYLKKHAFLSASRYNLKSAIVAFGASFFPFNFFIGELLKALGYNVMTDVPIIGKNWTHQIDVVAENKKGHFMIECKFHNQPGFKTDTKLPLNIYSRFKDVEYSWRNSQGKRDKFHQGWVVTNGKFTEDAIHNGEYTGLRMIGWDYPAGSSLKEMISKNGLYPVTCLSSLTNAQKAAFLAKGVILCQTIYDHPDRLDQFSLGKIKAKRILEEAQGICEIRPSLVSQ